MNPFFKGLKKKKIFFGLPAGLSEMPFFPALCGVVRFFYFFFFNDTATTEIYTLSLHDALPIFRPITYQLRLPLLGDPVPRRERSEEHTSELQSRRDLVCRLLLEKKKKK